MAGNHRAGDGRSRRVGTGRVVAAGTAAGALLAFGLMPLAGSARADVADGLIDEVFAPFIDATTGGVDWDSLASPAAWDGFLAAGHWEGVLTDLTGSASAVGLVGNSGTGGMLGDPGAVGAGAALATSGANTANDTAVDLHTPSTDSGLTPISTTGPYFTDADGKVVVLHGLNEVYKLAPYEPSATGFSNDDAAFLAANGFNAVRLGVIWAGVEPQPGVFNDAYLADIQQTIQTLQNHGIAVLIDMHGDAYSSVFGGEGAPVWATETGGLPNPSLKFPLNEFFNPAELHAWDAFWSNADGPNGVGLQTSYAQMYEHVADYFKGDSNLVGFEIMNEPSAGFAWPLCLLGCPGFYSHDLTPFYDKVTAAIRTVDPTTPTWYEPELISGEAGALSGLEPVDATHTVLSFHDYLGSAANLTMKGVEKFTSSLDIPAFMTEFGSSANSTPLTDTMNAANQHLFGWTEWEYSAVGDITTTGNGQGWLVNNPELPPTGANVDTAKLETLAQPYPQVVAGTPESWSYGSGTFKFSYSTEMASGSGDFGAGSTTTISVPQVEYPNGYHVTVTGGHVVSAANATELVIASNSGANTVTVTVAADGGSGPSN